MDESRAVGVWKLFAVTSLLMWIVPLSILLGFKYGFVPQFFLAMSPQKRDIWSSVLSVVSVNLVIGGYIYRALKESPSGPPVPDSSFAAQAKKRLAELQGTKVAID